MSFLDRTRYLERQVRESVVDEGVTETMCRDEELVDCVDGLQELGRRYLHASTGLSDPSSPKTDNKKGRVTPARISRANNGLRNPAGHHRALATSHVAQHLAQHAYNVSA